MFDIDKILGTNKKIVEKKEKKVKVYKGMFERSHHHTTKPGKIDDETWYYPDKSGIIKKGYWSGSYWDAKKKAVLDEKGKIIHKYKK